MIFSYKPFIILSPKNKLKGAIKSTAEMLMDAQSQVRNIEYLGHKALPYRMKHQEEYRYDGRYYSSILCMLSYYVLSYWLINFYGSPQIGDLIRDKLKFNDEIIRYTLLKKADKLKQLIR